MLSGADIISLLSSTTIDCRASVIVIPSGIDSSDGALGAVAKEHREPSESRRSVLVIPQTMGSPDMWSSPVRMVDDKEDPEEREVTDSLRAVESALGGVYAHSVLALARLKHGVGVIGVAGDAGKSTSDMLRSISNERNGPSNRESQGLSPPSRSITDRRFSPRGLGVVGDRSAGRKLRDRRYKTNVQNSVIKE